VRPYHEQLLSITTFLLKNGNIRIIKGQFVGFLVLFTLPKIASIAPNFILTAGFASHHRQQKAERRGMRGGAFCCPSACDCWTKPLRGGKTSAIFILSLWERLPNREKSWQNATHTVSGNEPERIMRISEKNLAMCKKIA